MFDGTFDNFYIQYQIHSRRLHDYLRNTLLIFPYTSSTATVKRVQESRQKRYESFFFYIIFLYEDRQFIKILTRK